MNEGYSQLELSDKPWNRVITATLRSFRSNRESGKWEHGEYMMEIEDRPDVIPNFIIFKPFFYANGNCKDNRGYVSVILREVAVSSQIVLSYIQISCTVAVVDVAGNKRFIQSFVCAPDVETVTDLKNFIEFGLDRYLKRETLLNDPDELLPGDCLTVCVEMDYAICNNVGKSYLLSRQPLWHSARDFGRCFISLDTDFGRELCRVSEFFRRASETPMIEGRTRKVRIPAEEIFAFDRIFNIIFKLHEEWWMRSISDISQVYSVAYKYDIQSVIDICRQFIKGLLSTRDDLEVLDHVAESAHEILELADMYEDSNLKDIVETYLESKKNFERNDCGPEKQLNEKLRTEWKCVFRDIGPSEPRFWMTRIAKPEFDFYQ